MGFLLMFLFWGVLLGLAIWIVVALFPNAHVPPPPPRQPTPPASAREILDQRYARGELTVEQYHDMRQTLNQ